MKPPQQSEDFPDAFYRVTAKGLYVRDGKVLLIQNYSDQKGITEWELPGGGVDFGETFHTTITREVHEEMGLEVTWIDEKPSYIWTTRSGSGRGMEWYYVMTALYRIELRNLNFTPTAECQNIGFFSKRDLRDSLKDLSAQVAPLAEAFDPTLFSEKLERA
jgi:ADP-ribose pyrophosphatase YjhB (NUDIX family)